MIVHCFLNEAIFEVRWRTCLIPLLLSYDVLLLDLEPLPLLPSPYGGKEEKK